MSVSISKLYRCKKYSILNIVGILFVIKSLSLKMVKKEYKKKLIQLIEVYFPKAKVYLFGSRAIEEESKVSDIDLLIDVGKVANKEKMALLKLSVDDLNIPLDVDIVDYYTIHKKFKQRIEKEKIIWKN